MRMRSSHALSWLGIVKLYIGAPMTTMSAPRNSSRAAAPLPSVWVAGPAAISGRTAASSRLSRCGIGSASRSRRTISRFGIARVNAVTIAAESSREAEASPRMLESMWRSFIGIRPWSMFVTWTRYVTIAISQERRSMRPRPIEMTAPLPHPLHEDCHKVSRILARIGEKWSMLVVMLLRDGPRRFNDIKRNTGSISQQMLTRTLRGLERDGMVTRTIFPTSPPQVEYSLTELGRSMSEPVLAFGLWVQEHLPEIDVARHRFDQRAKPGVLRAPNEN